MYLQITEAAKILDISRQWVHELINRGEIGTCEIAGRRVVLDDARFKTIRRQREKARKAKAATA